MIVFVAKRLGVAEPVAWRTVRPGDEIRFCELFDRWPETVTRPATALWAGGGPLSYADSIAGVSAQILANHHIDYRGEFGDWVDVRALVTETSVAIVARGQIVLASRDENPYLTLEDILAWMRACGGAETVIETWVGYGDAADAGSVLLEDVDPGISVIGWPDE